MSTITSRLSHIRYASARGRKPRAPALLQLPGRVLRGREAVLPALAGIVAFLYLAATQGGYRPLTWYPVALALLALLVTALVSLPNRKRVPRSVWIAVGLFSAYAAWTFLSITWAGQQGDAWLGANRTLLYACVFALFALWPIPGRSALVVIGALGLGIAGLGLVELLRLHAAADPGAVLVAGRLREPTGYTNAEAALWALGLMPCLFMASRRQVPIAVRALSLGASGLLLGLCLLVQSRGWAIALPIALVVLLVVTPGRVRLLAPVALLAAAAAVMTGPAFGVLEQFEAGERLAPAIGDAVRAILLTAAALTAVGAVTAVADLRYPLSARAERRWAVVAAVAVALVTCAGLATFIAREGSPVTRAGDAWEDFKRGYAETAGNGRPAEATGGSTRLTRSLGTNRYDFWKLAWKQFEERPIRGMGVENFQRDYLRRGKSRERPLYAHSLPLGVVSQTGLVGAALLLGALVAAGVAAARAVRRGSTAAAGAAGGALATCAYWLVHSSGDWLWEFPGLAAPALAMLGLASGLGPRRPARGAMAGRAVPLVARGRWVAVVAAVALLPAVSLGLPWLAALDVQRAGKIWSSRPAEAYERLDRAASLDPLSRDPKVTEGAIALRLGDLSRAERATQAALDRDPGTPNTTLQLAIVASHRGQEERAITLLERARELSPRDSVIATVLKQARRGKRLDPDAVERLYVRSQPL